MTTWGSVVVAPPSGFGFWFCFCAICYSGRLLRTGLWRYKKDLLEGGPFSVQPPLQGREENRVIIYILQRSPKPDGLTIPGARLRAGREVRTQQQRHARFWPCQDFWGGQKRDSVTARAPLSRRNHSTPTGSPNRKLAHRPYRLRRRKT